MKVSEHFTKELSYIKNVTLRKIVAETLDKSPECIVEIPASSSGKYHPEYTIGVGGLVRHIKAAVGIAHCMIETDIFPFVALDTYTEEEIAAQLGISVELYKQYEANGQDIPINVIYQLAKLYKVDFSELVTGVSAKLKTYQVVRGGNGQKADRYPGYEFKDLAYHFNNTIMQPFLVTLDPSDKQAALVSHKGEEFNLVLEGTVVVTFGDQDIVLEKGDSIYFNPTYPHGQRCGGDAPATFLTMIAE